MTDSKDIHDTDPNLVSYSVVNDPDGAVIGIETAAAADDMACAEAEVAGGKSGWLMRNLLIILIAAALVTSAIAVHVLLSGKPPKEANVASTKVEAPTAPTKNPAVVQEAPKVQTTAAASTTAVSPMSQDKWNATVYDKMEQLRQHAIRTDRILANVGWLASISIVAWLILVFVWSGRRYRRWRRGS